MTNIKITTTTTSQTTNTTNTTATTSTTVTTTTTTDAPANAVGDADGDGKIDSSDIFDIMLYVAYCAVGKEGGLTADQIAAADVDKNGKVDSTDVFYVMYYVALKGAGTPKTWEEIIK